MPSFDVTIKAEITLTVEAADRETAEFQAYEDVHRSPSPLWRGIKEVTSTQRPTIALPQSTDTAIKRVGEQ